ncbi:hypothetical protein AYI70_g9769 [Smittium culicis]|uniref:Uncharacterized protein n=1 Tax=Smittium culicis TaxID=133412 RepID=A0A1R1X9Q5_9FUNG|nr:hypothetical protein AYI70_g11506 [Smittium culicis]OMJ11367.1 hypothetical protein AYI70_g9769 [Smittium culicis]
MKFFKKIELGIFLCIASHSFTSADDAQTPQQQCVASKCNNDNGNVNCVASCYGVPSPDSSAITQTNKCYEDCIRASDDASTRAACNATCISKFYNPNEKNAPTPNSSPTSQGPPKPSAPVSVPWTPPTQKPPPPQAVAPHSPSSPPVPANPNPVTPAPLHPAPPQANDKNTPAAGAAPGAKSLLDGTGATAQSGPGWTPPSQPSNQSGSSDKKSPSITDEKLGDGQSDMYDSPYGSNFSEYASGMGNGTKYSGFNSLDSSAFVSSKKSSIYIAVILTIIAIY